MEAPFFKKYNQAGQTLIETMVGLLILTIGISSSLALAVYSLNASTNLRKQVIATGLAREGVEAVKNMRDTNWLKQVPIDANCYNFSTGANTAFCYKNWETQVYSIKPLLGGSGNYRLKFDTSLPNFWDLESTAANPWYGLDFDQIIANGFYTFPTLVGAQDGSSDYYRKIIITEDNSAPTFNHDIGPRLQIASMVWWRGKGCPVNRTDIVYPAAAGTKCLVTLVSYLTNWKNY